jgi:hypothetical protein
MKRICPQEEVLADYLAGRLSEENTSDLESHLAGCRRCLDEITISESLIQHDDSTAYEPVPHGVTESAVILVKDRMRPEAVNLREKCFQVIKNTASWISARLSINFYPRDQLAPVRSSERTITNDYFHVQKSFKEIITDIEVEKTGRKRAGVRVSLVSDTRKENNIRVTLLDSNEREMASFLLSRGFVLFEDIPFGHYRLAFVRSGRRIGMYQFEIKDSSHAKRL